MIKSSRDKSLTESRSVLYLNLNLVMEWQSAVMTVRTKLALSILYRKTVRLTQALSVKELFI